MMIDDSDMIIKVHGRKAITAEMLTYSSMQRPHKRADKNKENVQPWPNPSQLLMNNIFPIWLW